MIIHRSNRTEVLIAELAVVVGAKGPSPFTKETLVVQGRGMERWLSMRLADRLGIWANPEVLSLHALLDLSFKRVLDSEINPAFDAESLMWSIAELLPELAPRDEFAAIRRYLETDSDGRRRIQLSFQIASVFYEYMTHRPEMMVAWQNADRTQFQDPDEPWQAMLWRALLDRLGTDHLAGRAGELIARLEDTERPVEGLPTRVSIFGVSSLPRLYLDLFTALSRHVELHLFILSPSQEYWADIATPHEARRELRRDQDQDEASLHLDETPTLLSSLGRLGRDFHRMIEESGRYEEPSPDLYREPQGVQTSMLSVLQSDILNLRARGSEDAPRLALDTGDHSIRVHSCHGPMREVEVLCEELLGCFEADPTLEPQHVVVMTPSIKTYAPFIEAVFGIRSRKQVDIDAGEGAIPFRIADRWPQPGDQVVDAFNRGLDFIGGRFTVSDALDLLDIDCVRRQFDFEAQDLEVIKRWLVDAGVRWGVDAKHRETLDQPGYSENTWQFGFDRLLLGYGVPDDQKSMFQGVRPIAGVEGQGAERLGRLLDFHEFLVQQRERLADARTPAAWRDALLEFLAGFIVCDDDFQDQHQLIRSALDKILKQSAFAEFGSEISMASIREQLDRGLEHMQAAGGFLAGGVTFCELVPMRSIPFRVVCLLGLNDEAFPRIRHSLGFDLIAKMRRVGDRTTREDDRYLFLEALLSARERLVISYVGQSLKDGARLPPSAVVSELIDALAETFEIPGATERETRENVKNAIVVQHPLKPYSLRYFTGEDKLDFKVHSARYCEAARQLAEPTRREPAFVSNSLEDPAEEIAIAEDHGDLPSIDLDDLIDFFQNPSRYFLRQRMQLSMHEDRDAAAPREPFEVAGLDAFQIGSELLELVRSGISTSDAYPLLKSTGRLPHGLAGRIRYDELSGEVEALAAQALELAPEVSVPVSVDVIVAGGRVRGRLSNLNPNGQVLCRFAKLGRRSELGVWIRHLLLNVARREMHSSDSDASSAVLSATAPETFLVGRPAKTDGPMVVRFSELSEPEQLLSELVELFRASTHAPLPLFPETSREFVSRLKKQENKLDALEAARKKYEDSFQARSDGDDADNALLFRGVNLFDPTTKLAGDFDFADVANRVFAPMLDAREEVQ